MIVTVVIARAAIARIVTRSNVVDPRSCHEMLSGISSCELDCKNNKTECVALSRGGVDWKCSLQCDKAKEDQSF